jgi:integrase
MAKHRANGEGSIRKRADGRWEARYTDTREVDPAKRAKSIIHKSQKSVVEKLKVVLSEISGGALLLANDNPSVAEWLSFWLQEYKISELRDSTFESYERNIQHYLTPLIGHIKVKELTGLHIQQMYNKLQEAKDKGGYGLGGASVIKIKNILSGALRQAIIGKIIRSNPILETNPPKTPDPDIRILSKAEQQKYIAVLPFYNTGNMFAVSLATGMRIGELCALDTSDVNREQKYIAITKTAGRRKDKYTGEVAVKIGPPKTKHSVRKIPLLPSVEVMLERQALLVSEMRGRAGANWKENTFVFPTDEGKIHDLSGMRASMGRILSRAGLPHMTIHSLRHTYATTALNAGVAAQNVARLLGHKDGATTLRFYAHYINTEAMAQLAKLEEQNISHLGITAGELAQIVSGAAEAFRKCSVSETLGTAIASAKNFPGKKSVELVLSVCEDILCRPLDGLSASDKETLLGALAQYSVMKRQYAAQERAGKPKSGRGQAR